MTKERGRWTVEAGALDGAVNRGTLTETGSVVATDSFSRVYGYDRETGQSNTGKTAIREIARGVTTEVKRII